MKFFYKIAKPYLWNHEENRPYTEEEIAQYSQRNKKQYKGGPRSKKYKITKTASRPYGAFNFGKDMARETYNTKEEFDKRHSEVMADKNLKSKLRATSRYGQGPLKAQYHPKGTY